jgi:hypothetical protein
MGIIELDSLLGTPLSGAFFVSLSLSCKAMNQPRLFSPRSSGYRPCCSCGRGASRSVAWAMTGDRLERFSSAVLVWAWRKSPEVETSNMGISRCGVDLY